MVAAANYEALKFGIHSGYSISPNGSGVKDWTLWRLRSPQSSASGQSAAARDYRYLYVDASPDSQPILARLGFSRLARTTPYIWDPRAQA